MHSPPLTQAHTHLISSHLRCASHASTCSSHLISSHHLRRRHSPELILSHPISSHVRCRRVLYLTPVIPSHLRCDCRRSPHLISSDLIPGAWTRNVCCAMGHVCMCRVWRSAVMSHTLHLRQSVPSVIVCRIVLASLVRVSREFITLLTFHIPAGHSWCSRCPRRPASCAAPARSRRTELPHPRDEHTRVCSACVFRGSLHNPLHHALSPTSRSTVEHEGCLPAGNIGLVAFATAMSIVSTFLSLEVFSVSVT